MYGFGLAFFFVLLFRTVARGIRRELFSYGVGINNVLLVGDTKTTQRLIDALEDTRVSGYKVLGVVGGVKHAFKTEIAVSAVQQLCRGRGLSKRRRQLHTIIQTELYAALPSKTTKSLPTPKKTMLPIALCPVIASCSSVKSKSTCSTPCRLLPSIKPP